MPGLDTLLGLFLGDQGATPNPLYKKNLDYDEQGNWIHPDTGAIVPDSVANQPYNTPSFWTKMLHPDVAQQEFAYNNQPYNASVANDITRSIGGQNFNTVKNYLTSQIGPNTDPRVASILTNNDFSPQNILGAQRGLANNFWSTPSQEAQNQYLQGQSTQSGLINDLALGNSALASGAQNIGLKYDIANKAAEFPNIGPAAALRGQQIGAESSLLGPQTSLTLDTLGRELSNNPSRFAAQGAQNNYIVNTTPIQQDIDTSRLGQQRSDLPFANSSAHKAAIANSFLSGFTPSPPLMGGHVNPDNSVTLGYNKDVVPESMQQLEWAKQNLINQSGKSGSTITLSNGKTVQMPPSSNTYDALSGQPILAPPINPGPKKPTGTVMDTNNNAASAPYNMTDTVDHQFMNVFAHELTQQQRNEAYKVLGTELAREAKIPTDHPNLKYGSSSVYQDPAESFGNALITGHSGGISSKGFSREEVASYLDTLPEDKRTKIYDKVLTAVGAKHTVGSTIKPIAGIK